MTDATAERIFNRLQTAFPRGAPLSQPDFDGTDWECVKECLDTGWVSSAGPFVEKFEKKLQELTGSPSVVSTVNGTSALTAVFFALGVRSGDEVVVPSLTFVATVNSFAILGAVPHFVDVETERLAVDPVRLREHFRANLTRGPDGPVNKATGRRVRALCVMHTFGHPARIEELAEVAGEFDLPLIEDAAEALGSFWGGKHLGRFGRVGILSFNGNKIITTGGGGAILTEDAAWGAHFRKLVSTARKPHPFEIEHDEVAFNFRMPNLNAALGYSQLSRLDPLLKRRRALHASYLRLFREETEARVLSEPSEASSNYWLQALILEKRDRALRDRVLTLTNDAKIGCRPVWKLMHRLPMYASAFRADLSRSEEMEDRIVNLPSSTEAAGG